MWAEIQQSRMYLSRSDVQQARYPAKLASKQTKSLYPRYCSYNVREMSDTSSDWVEILEPRSRERMYINLSTGECGWAPPANVPVRQSDGNQWWELFDTHNGRFYYYNSASRQTVWHRPRNCDVVPLARLQARKRSSESQLHGNAGLPPPDTAPSERRCKSLPRCSHPPLPPPLDPEGGGRDASAKARSDSMESRGGRKDVLRDTAQRWQPPPGSKAAMLVKVNSVGRNQGAGPVKTPQLLHSSRSLLSPNPASSRRSASHAGPASPASPAQSAMAASADCKQAFHLKKTEDGHFCPVSPGNLAGSTSGSAGRPPRRAQGGTPRPASPQHGLTAPLYDHPPMEMPVYDEPLADMEVEGGHPQDGPSVSRPGPQNAARQGQGQGQQATRLLPLPVSHTGSWNRGTPSETDYSPAGREGIRHMVNVDPAASGSLPPPETSKASSGPERAGAPSPAPQREGRVERRQTWRTLEASLLRGMEARQGGPGGLASPECPSATPLHCQDSGYSTGPSPSLCRQSRRRPPAAQGRPGSMGGGAELDALSERLMAEVRAAVSRSSTVRDSRASLDTQASGSSAPNPPRARSSRCSGSREDVASSSHSLYRPGSHGDAPRSPLVPEGPGRQKRTYEKVDTLEKLGLSSPGTPQSPSQVGTLESQERSDSGTRDSAGGRRAPPGGGGGGDVGVARGGDRGGGGEEQLSRSNLCQAPPLPTADPSMADWASKNLNLHTQGLFRRRVSIANMLSWNQASIKKPMLITSDRALKKEACEMFKLVQAYMGDRPSRLDRRHVALLVVTKCWLMPGLRDELYVQLVRQTTENQCPQSLASGWELMAICLAFFSPSPKFRRYLEGYIQRHLDLGHAHKFPQYIMDQQDMKNKKNSKSWKKRKQSTDEEEEGLPVSTYAKYCYRQLQRVAVSGGKKGLRKPTLEEVHHGRSAIVTPSLFGSSLEDVMERQRRLFPDRRLPWAQTQLSQCVLALGGAHTEGIFRVPGDIDEVNALKLQVDQWKIPEDLSDPNVPASLLKLWYRELEEPLIPMSYYRQCISSYEDPETALNVVQSLPQLNYLVLCYFIHFLQVFAQPVNVSKTKMDVNNLAMVMAPNCLRCQSDDPRVIFENTRKEMSFLRLLIVHLDTSFISGVL
ncbi:rho GTPase-activating protein 39-like isoform X1 [Anguilla anguilla]|uniref:rho GTPase-activating protein 39-like isoform X1 n=2 Tax=Anguilla anguilla TaxID=7936 RepID=UPI0015AD313E|nr:rho GTPase-activating protein 39-like isoform X1 [Anguilla anguilla]